MVMVGTGKVGVSLALDKGFLIALQMNPQVLGRIGWRAGDVKTPGVGSAFIAVIHRSKWLPWFLIFAISHKHRNRQAVRRGRVRPFRALNSQLG